MVNTRRKSYKGDTSPDDASDTATPSEQTADGSETVPASPSIRALRTRNTSLSEPATPTRRTRTNSLPAECEASARKRTRKSSESSETKTPVRTRRRSSSVTSDSQPSSQDAPVEQSSRKRRSSSDSVASPSPGRPLRKSLLERYKTQEEERLPALPEEDMAAEDAEESRRIEEKKEKDTIMELQAVVDDITLTVTKKDENEEPEVDEVTEKNAKQITSTTEKEAPASLSAAKMAEIQNILGTGPTATKPEQPTIKPSQPPPPPDSSFTRIKCPQVPRGKPKSGRFWKPLHTKMSQAIVTKNRDSYDVRMKKLQQLKVVRDLEKQMRDEHKEKMEDLRKRREHNKKKAEENALKAEVYQVVKNPNKIKRMKKKQLRKLATRDTTVVGKSVLDD